MSGAQTFVEEVQATITPVGPGDRFSLLLIPLRPRRSPDRCSAPRTRSSASASTPCGRCRPAPTSARAGYNRRLYDRCKELGGSQYPISAVVLDADDWAVHYGEEWERLRRAKRRYDRDDVLASGPDVLGRC